MSQDALSAHEQLLALVARMYFIENKGQKEIKDDSAVRALYRKTLPLAKQRGEDQTLSQATVNRLLQRAQAGRVVAISIDASFAVQAIRELELSRRVRDAFRLDECFALRPESLGEGNGTNERRAQESAVDANNANDAGGESEADEERLILSLVNYTAEEVQGAFTSGDHVLCAGGRTICWLARAVRRFPATKTGLIFTPLSGRLWVEDFKTGDADIMERPLDADDAVHIFAEAFEDEPGGQFSQINQPLYCSDKDPKRGAAEAEKILRDHCAIAPDGSWNWGLPDAARAYVGVGSLNSSTHRLAIFLRKFEANEQGARGSYLRAAGPSLQQIKRLCKKANLPLPGDMGNRLFPCLMLPTELMALRHRQRLAEDLQGFAHALKDVAREIEDLNARAVVMSWKHLRRTRGVRVICAGRSKCCALWTVILAAYFDKLCGAAPLVKELTTDHATATRLISELDILKNDKELCAWYQDRLQDCGLLATMSPSQGPR